MSVLLGRDRGCVSNGMKELVKKFKKTWGQGKLFGSCNTWCILYSDVNWRFFGINLKVVMLGSTLLRKGEGGE